MPGKTAQTTKTREDATAKTLRPEPLFGVNIVPYASELERAFDIARTADSHGIDIVGIQDHPYQGRFVDTWTLISVLAASTKRVRFMTNVADLPLRPPAMLAKAAATLDILTKGRVEIGLGAGGFWEAISSYGGPNRSPGEAVKSLEEAIQVMRLIWDWQGASKRVSFQGQFYSLKEARPGPRPHHRIGIWLGALGPKMLQLTGRLGDGWSISQGYVPPEKAFQMSEIINRAAEAVGRSPGSIRRNYNIGGVIAEKTPERIEAQQTGMIPSEVTGSAGEWVKTLVSYYRDFGFDSFNFWPSAGDEVEQIRLFAEKVVPKARESMRSVAHVQQPSLM